MTAPPNKSLASQLTRRIFTVYLALAISLILLQIGIEYSNTYTAVSNEIGATVHFFESAGASHNLVIERTKFSILSMLTVFLSTTAALWIILTFFADQFLTKPLRHFIAQIKSLNFVENFNEAIQTHDLDIGPTPSIELSDLRATLNKFMASVAASQNKMQKESAEAVNLAKAKFLSAASHDLRQPMHAFNLYLASLAELEVAGPVQVCVDNLSKCAKAMNDMLDTLLEISNIDAGATQASFSIFPIASPIDRVQAEFEPLANAKGLTLHIVRSSAFVYSDEEIVERVLCLLVSNAVRYTEQGRILIGCRRMGKKLRLAVMDTGLGIETDKQQAIFEEHFQLDNYERNRAKGLGLGLTIAQRLAKLLETPITLNSKLGSGSMFAVDLPRIDLDAIEPIMFNLPISSSVSVPIIPSRQRAADFTIMVIDDEPLILDATRTLLECWGYTVITAINEGEAVEKLTKNQCLMDMIICDYLLGGETGMSIIATLRGLCNKEVPALLVTGVTLPDHIETMQASGLAFMYKPLDHDKLRVVLSQLIRFNHDQ
jgi:signal transduction histidine kinase/ActR/RegA family two-component response regulator